jgi:hypothetical protein
MKRLLKGNIIVFITLVSLMLGGCESNSTDSDEEYAYASVRFIHSAPSTELIDFAYLVYGEDYYADAVTEASYGEQYGYFAFVADSRTFRVYLSETNLSVANTTISLTENGKYTIIATDLEATINPELMGVADAFETPPSGKVFLRFIHASADAPNLNIIKKDSSALLSDIARYQASDYVELDAGTYEFTAVSSDSGTELLTMPPLTLISSVIYTAILSGSVYGLPGPELNVRNYQETGVE